MLSKDELKKSFQKEWEKHYKLNVLIEKGFKRYVCKKCSSPFWSTVEREFCEDANCVGYRFIGDSPVKKPLGYVETWKKLEEYFVKNNHTSIKPYPTVARWRKDLYFNIASINNFQPYVVNGEIEPPANPLIVPQTCIRFGDVSNIGVTGRHYTNFVMVGQHAFNTEKTGLFYWKEQAIEHDINYLQSLGIPTEEITFREDIWMGGGNFGPSIEYFCRGLELGNCVFMQFENLPDGSYRELKTKVIDMGAGLSRLCWITNPVATSYDLVFYNSAGYVKKALAVEIDEKLFLEYSKLAGTMNVDEQDVVKQRKEIAAKLGMDERELVEKLEPLFAAYAICDHTQTLLFTISDGMLPSNSGGGYNLRMLLRRCFGMEERFHAEIDYHRLFKLHSEMHAKLFPSLEFLPESAAVVVDEERVKYLKSKETGYAKAVSMLNEVKKSGKEIGLEQLKILYQSYGIPAEVVSEAAQKAGAKIDVPPNFYNTIRGEEEIKQDDTKLLTGEYQKTEQLCYGNVFEHDAKIIGVEGDQIILDKSAFYPEGGGQKGDTGTINGMAIGETLKEGGVVIHKVEKNDAANLKEGIEVKVRVDQERRKIIMCHHTGAHLLHAAATIVLGKHVWQHGSHKDQEKGHLDLTHYRRITEEELARMEDMINNWIRENLQVKREIVQRNIAESKYGFVLYQGGYVPGKELSIVSIGNGKDNNETIPIDVEACGGTHVSSTGELGFFKIVKRESVQDNLERITFTCGKAAQDYVRDTEKLLRESAHIFSVNNDLLPSTCKRFFEEWKQRDKIIEKLMARIVDDIVESNKKSCKLGLEKQQLQALATRFLGKKHEIIVSNGNDYIAASHLGNAKKLLGDFLDEKGKKGLQISGSDKVAFATADNGRFNNTSS